MSQPIFQIIKSKDYEFIYNYRKLKTEPTNSHPFNRPASVYRTTKGNIQISRGVTSFGSKDPLSSSSPSKKQQEEFYDPLSSSTQRKSVQPKKVEAPKAKIDNPLENLLAKKEEDPLTASRPSTSNSLAQSMATRSLQGSKASESSSDGNRRPTMLLEEGQLKEDKDEEDDENEKIDLEELNTAALGNLWKEEIRGSFLKVFDPKKLENLKIRNPFKDEKFSNESTLNCCCIYFKKKLFILDMGIATQELHKKIHKRNKLQRTNVTFSYYIKSIEAIKRDLMRSWKRGDKVLALQLSIQAAKLLMDTEEPNFYPAKYTYIVDVLDTFSLLVFERIKKLSFPKLSDQKLKELKETNIIGADINESARDICRNWFLKISVIRELIPRIYIEASLIRNLVFLNKDKLKPAILRLIKTCRGITDPLIAGYCKAFILRIAIEIMPKEKVFMRIVFNDFLLNMREGGRFQHKSCTFDEYITLFEPVLEIIFKYYSQNATMEDFRQMLKIYESSSQHAEILKKFIKYFTPTLITDHILEIDAFIDVHSVKNRIELYTNLVEVMGKSLPPTNIVGAFLQKFVRDMYEIKDFVGFLNFLAVLLDFISKNYDANIRSQFLHSTLNRFSEFFSTITWGDEERNMEAFQKLKVFLDNIVGSCTNISEILALEPFLQFVQYLPSSMKKDICQKVLKIFSESESKLDDPLCVHALLSIAKSLNDDYGFSLEDEEKVAISKIIKKFISNVDYGKDIEQTLSFYTEVRAYFGNLPGILENLIDAGLELAEKCRKYSKGKITKAIYSYIQAIISFCLISISSIENKITQFDNYIRCAQGKTKKILSFKVALSFNLTSQAETLFKSTIGLFPEFPEYVNGFHIQQYIEDRIKAMISFMIVLPENPENDPLHVFNGLYTALFEYFKWDERNGIFYKTDIMCNCLTYLGVQLQEKLPYHVPNVKSNDSLYAEAEVKAAIFQRYQEVLQDISKNLEAMNQKKSDDLETIVRTVKINMRAINGIMVYLMPCNLLINLAKGLVEVLKKYNTILSAKNLKANGFVTVPGFMRSTLKNIKKNLNDDNIHSLINEVAKELGVTV